MQNHKKQLALTGSPNITYSPRSTSSISSNSSVNKRKFSAYEQQQILMHSRAKFSKNGELTCLYCTKDDFSSLEQLNSHVQQMHSSILQAECSNDQLSFQPFSCEFCTMKFPSIQLMLHHLKSTHLDRIQSPNSYLEQFNRNLLSTYSYYSGEERKESGDIKQEVRSPHSAGGGDEQKSENGDFAKTIKAEKNEDTENEQMTPTDLSQPKVKKLKLEAQDGNSLASHDSSAKSPSPAVVSTPPGAYLCNQCNAGLPDFESFRSHLKSHLEHPQVTSFLCQHCGVTLNDQVEYERHVSTHFLVTNTEFLCQNTCNKTFGKSDDLQKHLFDTHAQSLFKCTICSEIFESKVTIQVHFAVAHSNEIKIFRCSACSEMFRTEREFR
jgi:hypothetical protein